LEQAFGAADFGALKGFTFSAAAVDGIVLTLLVFSEPPSTPSVRVTTRAPSFSVAVKKL
jgi:hypothetical protein